jgi:hypothetical protein
MLEYCGIQRPLHGRAAEGFCFGDERGDARCQIFIVETGGSETFDQQSVTSQYQNRIDSRTLTKRAREISDVGHWW